MYFSIFTFKNQEEKPLSKFTEHLKQNSSPEGVSNRAFISYSSYKISTSEYFSISYKKKNRWHIQIILFSQYWPTFGQFTNDIQLKP